MARWKARVRTASRCTLHAALTLIAKRSAHDFRLALIYTESVKKICRKFVYLVHTRMRQHLVATKLTALGTQ